MEMDRKAENYEKMIKIIRKIIIQGNILGKIIKNVSKR